MKLSKTTRIIAKNFTQLRQRGDLRNATRYLKSLMRNPAEYEGYFGNPEISGQTQAWITQENDRLSKQMRLV